MGKKLFSKLKRSEQQSSFFNSNINQNDSCSDEDQQSNNIFLDESQDRGIESFNEIIDQSQQQAQQFIFKENKKTINDSKRSRHRSGNENQFTVKKIKKQNYQQDERRKSQRQKKMPERKLINHAQVTKKRSKKSNKKQQNKNSDQNLRLNKTGRPKNSQQEKQFLQQYKLIKQSLFFEAQAELLMADLINSQQEIHSKKTCKESLNKRFNHQSTYNWKNQNQKPFSIETTIIKSNQSLKKVFEETEDYLKRDNFPKFNPQQDNNVNIFNYLLQTSLLGLIQNYEKTFLLKNKSKSKNMQLSIPWKHLKLILKIFLRQHKVLNQQINQFIQENQDYILNLLKQSKRVIKSLRNQYFQKQNNVIQIEKNLQISQYVKQNKEKSYFLQKNANQKENQRIEQQLLSNSQENDIFFSEKQRFSLHDIQKEQNDMIMSFCGMDEQEDLFGVFFPSQVNQQNQNQGMIIESRNQNQRTRQKTIKDIQNQKMSLMYFKDQSTIQKSNKKQTGLNQQKKISSQQDQLSENDISFVFNEKDANKTTQQFIEIDRDFQYDEQNSQANIIANFLFYTLEAFKLKISVQRIQQQTSEIS